jgi:hypothetical protein
METMTQSKFTPDRMEELEQLQDLLHTVSYLDQGSNFLGKTVESIAIAKTLCQTNLGIPRESFIRFLFKVASEDKEQP